MKLKIKFNSDTIFSIYIAAYYALSVLTRVSLTLFQDSVALKLFLRIGTYILIMLVLLKIMQKKNNIRIFVFLELAAGILFIISNIMGNLADLDWMSIYKRIATTYVPLSIAAYNIVDRKKLIKSLYVVSLISVPILTSIVVLSYGNWGASYDMSLGYVMMFSTLILLVDFTVSPRVINIILAIFMSFLVLFVGSRGPFICILAFVFIELFLSKRYNNVKKALIFSAIILLSAVISMNIDSILMFVYQTSIKLGFNSRNVYLLMRGEIASYDSGRKEIWKYYMNLINQNPVLGCGVVGNWISDNIYPHNIILEMLLSFGYPLGGLLLAAVSVIVLKAIRIDEKYSSAIAILFVSYCAHLLVSESYLKVWQFFVGVALCIPKKIRLEKHPENHRGAGLEY